jgi:hypothetical protein
MPFHNVPANVGHQTLRMQKIHADGRVEDLGIKAYFNKNPIIHFVVNAYIAIRDKFRK